MTTAATSATSTRAPEPPKIAPRIRQRLLDSVTTNSVTIVVGPTGCGKSTQVPRLLLQTYGTPILCTQPRRLAVVSVATRVAEECHATLGGNEVGYHVGQSNHALPTTRLVFTTAGILLEELRAQGVHALLKYRVVILDECHERSPEQELCLAIIQILLRNPKHARKIRIVLMSATFDHARYCQFFSRTKTQPSANSFGFQRGFLLGNNNNKKKTNEKNNNATTMEIDTITLETANMVDTLHQSVKTLYLEDISREMKQDYDSTFSHSRFLQSMKHDPDAELEGDDGGKSLSLGLLNFIRSLVLWLDRQEEESIENVFVIFAPTYRHLEQIYDMLGAAQEVVASKYEWNLGVLHSSMDMEDCLQTMQSGNDNLHSLPKRKILLASAIADSSITIPGVTCVIDLCRALHVSWNPSQKSHLAKTTWASQSICQQRQGRTGRTNPGRCFRLVPKGFYLTRLKPWEEPLLAISSCRDEVLKLLCAASATNSLTDPIKVLQACLDPPPSPVVNDAFLYLQSIGACVAKGRNGATFVPTKMGDLLAALPFSVEDSQIIVAGAQVGLLHETLALRSILSHKPAPIMHHFGDTAVNDANILCYYDRAKLGTKESLHMANLAAFLYWDVTWNQYRSQAAMEKFSQSTRQESDDLTPEYLEFVTREVDPNKPSCNVWKWCPTLEEKHTEWCRSRGINPTSVRAVAELMDAAWNVFYLSDLEPEWLRSTDPTPLWRRFRDWKGRPMNDSVNTRDILAMAYGFYAEERLSNTLMALSEDPRKAVNEMTRDDILGIASLNAKTPIRDAHSLKRRVDDPPLACVHFLEGRCSYGDKCRNSHSPFAIRPPCRFFFRGDGCARGDTCIFSHDDPNKVSKNLETANVHQDPLRSHAPVMRSLQLPGDVEDWFDEKHSRLFLLGDGNFEFARSLNALSIAPPFASDIRTSGTKSVGSTKILELDATRLHMDSTSVLPQVFFRKVDTFFWNFPFMGDDEHETANEELLLGTFHSLLELLRMASSRQYDSNPRELMFAVTLQGDQFSRWNVLRSAMRTGWRLSSWGVFDYDDFPGYRPRRANGDEFPVDSPRLYLFKLSSTDLYTVHVS